MAANTRESGRAALAGRFAFMLLVPALVAFMTGRAGLDARQTVSSSIFILIIMATLLFWNFRLAIAFIGIGILVGADVLDLRTFIEECKIDVILFLVGMMVVVGVLKELGLFTWIIQTVISTRRLTGPMFVWTVCVLGALMACVVDEVTSIVFVATLIFQVCDTLKLRPTPYLIMAVMATNTGSCGTMLGNPVGLLIGQQASPPLSFADFMIWSFPLMLAMLAATVLVVGWWFRADVRRLSERLEARRGIGLGLGPLVRVPFQRGLGILVALVAFIALHTRIETWLGLAPNTMLMVAPLITAGVLMIWRHDRARHYIEADVEWWTLLFFMMLFAVAGTLQHTGVTAEIAGQFKDRFGGSPLLLPMVVGMAAVGSAFVDNIVFVAAFMPVVNLLEETPLLWALLQGACLGGNITMIGSTANIVALGMLEKRYRQQIRFGEWLKVGALVGVVTCTISWAGLSLLSGHMPTPAERHAAHARKAGAALPAVDAAPADAAPDAASPAG